MLLNIKIRDVIDVDASKIISCVTDTLFDIRKEYEKDPVNNGPYVEFSFEKDTSASQPIYRGEESTFSRYINGSKKE